VTEKPGFEPANAPMPLFMGIGAFRPYRGFDEDHVGPDNQDALFIDSVSLIIDLFAPILRRHEEDRSPA